MKRTHSAFTLVELLVVIAIIGILMGLAIPAVNRARESARRMECSNNVRNMALAATLHENSKRRLPGYVERFGLFAGGDDPAEPGNQMIDPHVKIGTWGVALLSFLEEQPTYEHWNEDRYPLIDVAGGEYSPTNDDRFSGVGFHPLAAPNLAVFQCPSSPTPQASFGRNNYISNNGESPWFFEPASGSLLPAALSVDDFRSTMDPANGAFNNKYQGSSTTANYVGDDVQMDDFKDGQGNTILISENVQAMPWHRAGYLDPADMSAGIVYPPSSPSESDISNALEVNFNSQSASQVALAAARYTNGMVWHYEDKDSASMPDRFGEACRPVPDIVVGGRHKFHKINGRGEGSAEDIFTLSMDETSGNFIDLARPSSAHTGGVNAGMADGTVKFIEDTIDYRVYQALFTLRGKSSNVPWPEFVLTDQVD